MSDKKQWLDDVKIGLKDEISSNATSFSDFRKKRILENISNLGGLDDKTYYTDLRSSRKRFPNRVFYFKTIARRMIKFLTFPIAYKQNVFNYNVAKYIEILVKENIELRKQIEILKEDVRNK
jgi:hypothetical protein